MSLKHTLIYATYKHFSFSRDSIRKFGYLLQIRLFVNSSYCLLCLSTSFMDEWLTIKINFLFEIFKAFFSYQKVLVNAQFLYIGECTAKTYCNFNVLKYWKILFSAFLTIATELTTKWSRTKNFFNFKHMHFQMLHHYLVSLFSIVFLFIPKGK